MIAYTCDTLLLLVRCKHSYEPNEQRHDTTMLANQIQGFIFADSSLQGETFKRICINYC